jgi:hypothetical protein
MDAWTIGLWAVGLLGGAAALYGLHRLALWLERDGWIRYLRRPPDAGAGGGAPLGELQKIYEPQTRHVYELKEEKRPRREAEGGEPGAPSA